MAQDDAPVGRDEYRRLAVDLRGAGHSDSPQGGYDKTTMAADVHGVMHALGF